MLKCLIDSAKQPVDIGEIVAHLHFGAPVARVDEQKALPAPFMVAPTGGCGNYCGIYDWLRGFLGGIVSEHKALPAPFLVAPSGECGSCKPQGWGGTRPAQALRPAEQQVLPRPILMAPTGCGNGGCMHVGRQIPTARQRLAEPLSLPEVIRVAPHGCGAEQTAAESSGTRSTITTKWPCCAKWRTPRRVQVN